MSPAPPQGDIPPLFIFTYQFMSVYSFFHYGYVFVNYFVSSIYIRLKCMRKKLKYIFFQT